LIFGPRLEGAVQVSIVLVKGDAEFGFVGLGLFALTIMYDSSGATERSPLKPDSLSGWPRLFTLIG
jgi:hypothetical protein